MGYVATVFTFLIRALHIVPFMETSQNVPNKFADVAPKLPIQHSKKKSQAPNLPLRLIAKEHNY